MEIIYIWAILTLIGLIFSPSALSAYRRILTPPKNFPPHAKNAHNTAPAEG